MAQDGEILRVLVIGFTDPLPEAIQRLPHELVTDIHRSCDLIIAASPVGETVLDLIHAHNAQAPLIVWGAHSEADAAPLRARHPDAHLLAHATPDDLAEVVARVASGRFSHGAPPVGQTLRRRSDELSILHAITEAVSQPLELQETLRTALDAIWEYTNFESGAIVLYDAETQTLTPMVWDNLPPDFIDAFALLPPNSHRWRVIQTGEPLFVADAKAASALAGGSLSFGADCLSGALLPLQARGHTIGLLLLGSAHAHMFQPEERALLMGIARAVGVAIDTARTLAQQQQRADELALLSDIGLILQETTELKEALGKTLVRIHKTLPFDALGIGKIDLIANRVIPFVSYGMPPVLKHMAAESAVRADQIVLTDLFQNLDLQTVHEFGATVNQLYPRAELPPEATLTIVPLHAREAAQGVLLLLRYAPHPISDSERKVLGLIGHRIGIALENAHLYEEMRQRALEVTALLAASETLSSNLDLSIRLEIIAERAKRLIKADGTLLFLLQDDGETLRPAVILHPEAEKVRTMSIRLGEGLTGRVALRSEGEIVNDVRAAHHSEGVVPPYVSYIPACYLSVPLRVEGHVLGVLTMSRADRNQPFNNSDLRLLSSLANQAAIAVDNARLIEETNRQRHLAEVLSRVSRLVSETFDLDKVLVIILRELQSVIEFDSGQVRLVEGDRMFVAHAVGYPASPVPEVLKMDVAKLSTSRWIVRNRRHLVIPDTHNYEAWDELKGTEYVRSWAGAPLISRGRVIGILGVESATPNAYNERHGNIIAAFANQVSATIDNARLFQRTEIRERESRILYEVTRLLVSLNVQAIPGYVLDKLQDAIHFDVGGMFIAGEPHRMVTLVARPISDQTVHAIQDSLLAFYRDLTGEPVNPRTIEAQVIGDFQVLPTMPPEEVPSRLVVPLIVGDNLIGCIQLSTVIPDAYGEDEERTLYTVATQTATALENAHLYETLKASHLSLRQAYEELAEADRVKDELVQNVSHEIRTPLTFIKSYVELLAGGSMGALTAQQRNALEIVARKTNVLKGLVDDIVSLKRINSETLDMQPFDLAETARQSVEGFLPTATEAGLDVALEIDPDLPPTLGDRSRIGQVLDNLLSNARKFSPEGSTVTVRVLDDGPHLRVEVEDEGIGIPEDKLDRVFERFYQVDGSTRRRYGGAGLGLAISKQIIEAHNGAIGVQSQSGRGSLFFFKLYKARARPEFEGAALPVESE